MLRFFDWSKNKICLVYISTLPPPPPKIHVKCPPFILYVINLIMSNPLSFQFRNKTVTAECMYSLLNGDDMYATFQQMNTRSTASWIFSKLYLYSFIALFIYVVLSLFIGIICDTYERLKVRFSWSSGWDADTKSLPLAAIFAVNCVFSRLLFFLFPWS